MSAVTLLPSDIVSIEDYFTGIVAQDPELNTLVLETSNNPFEMERFNEVSNSEGFAYPALAMLMPVITGDDNGMHDFEAKQEIGFCLLYPTDGTHVQKLEKFKKAQLAGWRILRRLRQDSKAGRFRLDKLSYKMAPFEYGSDNAVGQYVVLVMITNTNALIGA